MDDDFGVACGLEDQATGLELGAKLAMVVDLAIVGDPHRALGVRHRLSTAGDIDDAQPPMSQAHAVVEEVPVAIGSPMGQRRRHPAEHLRLDPLRTRGPRLQMHDACNPAHRRRDYGKRNSGPQQTPRGSNRSRYSAASVKGAIRSRPCGSS